MDAPPVTAPVTREQSSRGGRYTSGARLPSTAMAARIWPVLWAAAPAIAAEHMRRAGRAKICRFTAPPPDRISYLIAPRAVELPREAALFLEDLRWELQQHPDVTVYF